MRRPSELPGLAACAVAVAVLGALPVSALDPERRLSQATRQVWSLAEGLPQSSVFALLPSGAGDLYFGTGEGLVRFDGFAMRTFDSGGVAAMRNNRVNRLLETEDGALWIGTQGGLIEKRGGRFRAFGPADGLPEETIFALATDGRGNLVVGTGSGLYRRSSDRFEAVDLGGPAIEVRTVLADGARALWVGTQHGLQRLDAGAIERYGEADGVPPGGVLALGRDAGGALLVGSRRVVVRAVPSADGGARPRFAPVAGTAEISPARALLVDRDGSLWIGGDAGLFRRRPDGGTELARGDEGLPYDAVTALAEDVEGNLWVGTDGGGLARFHDGRFVPYGTGEGLPSDMVWTVLEDSSGTIWAGTDGAGLARREADGSWRAISRRDGLPGDAVYSLYEDSRRRLWVGTDGGPAWIENGLVHRVRGAVELVDGAFFSFVELPDGSILAGTQGHLLRIADGLATPHESAVGLGEFTGVAAALFRARDGSVWIGTNGAGIRHLRRDGTIESFGRDSGLGAGYIIDFFEDPDGSLWLTSDNGLFRLKDGVWRGLDRSAGMPSDRLFCIVLDDRDRFWLPTNNRGVAVVPRAQAIEGLEGRRERIEARLLSQADGLRSPECNGGKPGAWRDRRGRIWLPTTAGLAAIDPRALDLATPAPVVRIESASAGGRALDVAGEAALAADERTLDLAWTAPTFVHPERVRFRYRVEGVDPDWVPTADRRVRLERLPPGGARFVVEAAGEDGRFASSASFAFTIAPRPTERAAFPWLVGGALALAALVVARGVERIRRRALVRRQRELEAQVDERTSDLRRANDELARHESELLDANRRLQELTLLDPLTGIANRRRFDQALEEELSRARRFGSPVSLLLLDVDRFKAFNDRYGHPAGDECLRRIGALLRASVARAGDVVARCGGEEFAAILPGTPEEGARALAENVRRLVTDLAIPHADSPTGAVTSSIGLAVADTTRGFAAADLVAAADRALYRAKNGGRDRIESG